MPELILHSPGRELFALGGVEIYTYGVIMALAVFCAVMFSNYCANKNSQFPKDVFISLAPLLIITGLLGARLWYCILNYSHYLLCPFDILNFRDGGISIHGAILGGFFGLLFYARRKSLSLSKLCDFSVVGLALGQTIGRWGNFFNNEAFGLPTDLPLKLYIPLNSRPQEFIQYEYFHPTFLYESVADFLIFLMLFRLLNAPKTPVGAITLFYIFLYSLVRFGIELIRVDSNFFIFGLPFPAFISGILVLFSSLTLCRLFTKLYK